MCRSPLREGSGKLGPGFLWILPQVPFLFALSPSTIKNYSCSSNYIPSPPSKSLNGAGRGGVVWGYPWLAHSPPLPSTHHHLRSYHSLVVYLA